MNAFLNDKPFNALDSSINHENYVRSYMFYSMTGLKLIDVGNMHSIGDKIRKYVVASALSPEEITKKIFEYENKTNMYVLTEIENGKVYVYI